MTKRQALWALGLGLAAVAAFLVVYLVVLPIEASWTVNRILHYVWQGLALAAGAGGVVWLMKLKTGSRRRDVRRAETQRRTIALGLIVITAVMLPVVAMLVRDAATRSRLEAARDDLVKVGRALAAYREAHGGPPPAIEALAPEYLSREDLHYPFAGGPARTPLPDGPEFDASYRLTPEPEPDTSDAPQAPPLAVVAYLPSGRTWAGLTAVLYRDGRAEIRGEDTVESLASEEDEAEADAEPTDEPEADEEPPDGPEAETE